jgi:anti-sigma factor RsiW
MTVNDTPTLDCTDIRAMLSALVDDELDAARRHAAERHLAGCAACRTLLDEAEGIDALGAAAAGREDRSPLPAGFEDDVLRRIAGDPVPAPRSWTSWLGWVTAAAAVLLLGVVWWLDGSSAPAPGPEPVRQPPARSTWIRPVVNEVAQYPASVPTRAAQQALASSVGSPMTISSLTRDDAEALEGAALLLGMLDRADADDFGTVERVRAAIEYDELLPRLAVARADLPVEHRLTVLAAESVLYRVAGGPLSADDVGEIQDAIARMDLEQRIETLSDLRTSGASL